VTWTSPDPWHCYQCGAEGLGGREAGDYHDRTTHAPKPRNQHPVGSVVPPGIRSADVRAWGRSLGRPLGNRGRLPQDLIDAYVAAHKPRPVVDLDVVDELRALGNSKAAIAHRLGVTEGAIDKAESRRRTA